MILIPIALLIMLVVLKLSLGDWRSVLMPFTVVILSTVFTMGMIPLLGWKFSIIMCLAPIILISVANNYGIYLVSRHQELRESDLPVNGKEMIRSITGSLNMPILFSGLTTIAGLLGLLAHSIIPAQAGRRTGSHRRQPGAGNEPPVDTGTDISAAKTRKENPPRA
ncbi:MAG: MMPL family transporter [Marinilabiliales bacterium]|nr:MMPL family transporter [Marinilabiliales bacterium]